MPNDRIRHIVQGPATIMRHSGYRQMHFDLLFAHGRACPTMRIIVPERRDRQRSMRRSLPSSLTHGSLPQLSKLWPTELSAQWSPDHRRYYLDYSGPVSGMRGRVQHCWHGYARLSRSNRGPHGWLLKLSEGRCLLNVSSSPLRLIAS